jgi:hypothetical protein
MNKLSAFTTDTADVIWAHLHAPDEKFGADSSNHNISVVVDDQLQMKLDELLKETGATKINGLRTNDEGIKILKAKSKSFTKKGVHVFPCRDAGANQTDAVPFGGDKVRLRLAPAVLTRDGSLSLYLNGCQIIEKGSYDGMGGGFEPTEGFDGTSIQQSDTLSTDDIPF